MALSWKICIAYAAAQSGVRMMYSLFMFYSVNVWLEKFHISTGGFQVAQGTYAVWNALNDPWFAYLQSRREYSWSRTRRHAILHAAPVFCASFLMLWFPLFGNYGSEEVMDWYCAFQYCLALFLWDGSYTYVSLALCGLLADLSPQYEDRVRILLCSGIGGTFGQASVLVCGYFSTNLTDYSTFEALVIVIATMSLGLMMAAGLTARTPYDKVALPNVAGSLGDTSRKLGKESSVSLAQDGEAAEEDGPGDRQTLLSPRSSVPSLSEDPGDTSSTRRERHSSQPQQASTYVALTRQVLQNKNFRVFVLMNFLQELHITYAPTFMKSFTENLIPTTDLSSASRSMCFGLMYITQQIVFVMINPLMRAFGHYNLIQLAILIKIVMGLTMFCLTIRHTWAFMAFLIIDIILAECTFGYYGLVLSEISDEDQKIHKRPVPISTMIFGTNALLVKPAISLAPMLCVAFLNTVGYKDLLAGTASPAQTEAVRGSMFYMACFIPACLGVCQLFIWSRYSTKNQMDSVLCRCCKMETARSRLPSQSIA